MKKLKVRIAVAVDPETLEWNSCGWGEPGGKDVSDIKKMNSAVDLLPDGEQKFWVEAEICVSDTPSFIGSVTQV